MKRVTGIVLIGCIAAGCSHSNKELNLLLTGSDSVAVNFFAGDGSMDTVTVVKIIRDAQRVNQLAEAISADVREANRQCGYDGSLHFFKNNRVVQDVDFRINDNNCKYFWLKYRGRYLQAALADDAKILLEAVKKN